MTPQTTSPSRWYILSYLGSQRDAVKRLELIDHPYFAPLFFGQGASHGNVHDFLHFANYAFVFATQHQIYDLKRKLLHSFNFLPRNYGNGQEHPFVEERVIEQLRKVEEVYNGKIPFMPYTADVIVGDTIRILTGQFKDQQAVAITRNGSKYRQIILDIAGKFIIPLCKLKAGEFEIINYSTKTATSNTTPKVRKEDLTYLQEALGRYYRIQPVEESQLSWDATRIHDLVHRYKSITPTTHIQRVKTSLLLVMAFTILDDLEQKQHYIKHTLNLIRESSTSALKANAYATLYGCTFYEEYYHLFLSVRRTAAGTKDETPVARTSNLIDLYINWNLQLHPRKSTRPMVCHDPSPQWFALEMDTPMKEYLPHFQEEQIPTYDPTIQSPNGRRILLAHTTFTHLKQLQTTHTDFTFIIERSSNEDNPVTFTDTQIEDYRHLLTVTPDNLQQLPLTPELHTTLTKTTPTTIPLQGRNITGYISTLKTNGHQQQRFILYLQHLIAIAIPL